MGRNQTPKYPCFCGKCGWVGKRAMTAKACPDCGNRAMTKLEYGFRGADLKAENKALHEALVVLRNGADEALDDGDSLMSATWVKIKATDALEG